ncbi:MAG TPA: hypothetical protein PK323_05985 [Bacteroidia bacterium]|nr:hypothetical protein [Bacteroidia bacterium]
MKKIFSVSLIAIGALFLGSCDKDKQATFKLDKSSYIQGETIKTTNTTVKGSKYYKWNFGGTELYEKEPVFVLPTDQAPGEFIITCEATNNKNSSSSGRASSQTVTIVEASEGKLVFWNPGTGPVDIKIRLSNNNISTKFDTITYSSSSNPNCYADINHALFTNLKSGTYNYEAIDLNNSSNMESGTITLDDGFDCKSIQIF